jgi:aspartate 1-decarboxylase
MLNSKIHRATVTGADVSYEGSITIDAALMGLADILPYEAVSVWDIENGARFETYAIEGQRGSGVVCVNGAAARLVSAGDKVIIASFVELEDAEARSHRPKLVFVDEDNRPLPEREERPGQGDVVRLVR